MDLLVIDRSKITPMEIQEPFYVVSDGEMFHCKLSLFMLRLLDDKAEDAKKLVEQMFLTKDDLTVLRGGQSLVTRRLTVGDRGRSLRYLNDVRLAGPLRLLVLSFVEVSTMIGVNPGRESRIPEDVPGILRKRLLFVDFCLDTKV